MLRSIGRHIRRNKNKVVSSVAALALAFSVAPATGFAAENEDVVKLRIMETTDIHSNVMNYDYFSGKEVHDFGLVKTATLIKEAKEEAKNSLLFDNGDLIQGSPLADFLAKEKEWSEEDIHTVYKAMNLLDYDAGNYGNHEFNYGLDYLNKVIEGSEFPYVNANIYKYDGDDNKENDENYFNPYLIIDKEVVDEDGETHTIKVGVIGFVPPQIMQWDKANLEGIVTTHGIVETAEKFVPQMKADGADLVIAIPHSGIGSETQEGMAENATYGLSMVEGIDAIMFGHAHQAFPDGDNYGDITGVDTVNGTINGVPSVMPGFWGSHLGLIDFTVEKVDGEWVVQNAKPELRAIYDSANKEALVDADGEIVEAVHHDHEHTLEYVNKPVGETTAPLHSYFSQVKDDPTIQIVTDSQKQYVEMLIQGSELEGLPVLSAGAPFKAGRDGVTDYTDIEAGGIAIKDTTSLYKYPNTLFVLKLTGAEVREWLEWSAGQFYQIDPNSSEEQMLVRPNSRSGEAFPSYNFDIIDGVNYQIDVTVPQRYDAKGKEVINDSNRITNLEYNGEPVEDDQVFLVATNNYRASFTPIANPGGDNIVIESPNKNRQVLVNYIIDNGTVNPTADNNWSFAPIKGDVNLVFTSSPEAKPFAEKADDISFVEVLDTGFAKYSIDLAANTDSSKKANDHNYTVKAGDTLGKIGAEYGVSWKTLKEYNSIVDVRKLMPGQEILIPVAEGTANYDVYLVKSGDTLGEIASNNGMNYKELATYNNIKNPHWIYIGQEIKIPNN